jgi:UDP-hydrolysing UDP-N-acetyl-D-glucosamine 2-epimerase
MGEEPWRITVSGAPGLDNIASYCRLTKQQLEEQHGIDLSTPPLLVTYHSVTLEHERTADQVFELLGALDDVGKNVVFTYPNADTSGRLIITMIKEFCAARPWARSVVNLGLDGYFSLMRYAAAMVGNSSSGITEAPSFELPVVNIGNRQRGRLRAANVIDVPCARGEISEGVRRVVSTQFRDSLAGLTNPYGDGHASERIVARLKEVTIDDDLVLKRFHDVRAAAP